MEDVRGRLVAVSEELVSGLSAASRLFPNAPLDATHAEISVYVQPVAITHCGTTPVPYGTGHMAWPNTTRWMRVKDWDLPMAVEASSGAKVWVTYYKEEM